MILRAQNLYLNQTQPGKNRLVPQAPDVSSDSLVHPSLGRRCYPAFIGPRRGHVYVSGMNAEALYLGWTLWIAAGVFRGGLGRGGKQAHVQ